MFDRKAAPDLLAETRWLRNLVRGLVRDQSAADDVAQETLARVEAGPEPRHRRAFLATVARRLALRDRARERRRREVEARAARAEAESRDPAELTAVAELHRSAVDAVLALSAPLRETLLAHYLRGESLRAIAARQEIPVETVRSRHKRGLAQVRAALDRRDDERGVRGGRGAWLAVAGLLEPPRVAPVLAPALGVLVMSAKFWLVAVCVVAVAVVVWPRDPGGALPVPVAEGGGESAVDGVAAPAQHEVAEPERRGVDATTAAADAADPDTRQVRGVLSGRVLDELTLAPIEGAKVQWRTLMRRSADEPADDEWTETDAEGRYELSTHRADGFGWLGLRITKAGYAMVDPHLLRARPVPGADPAGPERRVMPDLTMPPGTDVAGHVFDAEGGPVADAHLLLSERPVWMMGMSTPVAALDVAVELARSGADGSYEVDRRLVPETAKPRLLYAVRPGVGIGWAPLDGLRRKAHTFECDVRFGALAELSVRVVDDRGQPIEGAHVAAEPQFAPFHAPGVSTTPWGPRGQRATECLHEHFGGRSDADGNLRLPGLPVVPARAAGQYAVRVHAEGHAPFFEAGLEPGRAEPFEIVLTPERAWPAAGRVTATDGRPIGGAVVELVAGATRRVVTDADGRFEVGSLPMALGQVGCQVTAVGYVPTYDSFTGMADDPSPLLAIEVEMVPAAELRGTVVDATDAPVEGVNVRVDLGVSRGGFPPQPGYTKTDVHGEFVLPTVPADRELQLVLRVGGGPSGEVVVHRAHASESPLRLVVPRRDVAVTSAVEARILGSDGEPQEVQKAWLYADASTGEVEAVSFRADAMRIGMAVFDAVSPGDYRLEVQVVDGPEFEATVSVPPGQPLVRVRAIAPVTGRARVRLTNPHGVELPRRVRVSFGSGQRAYLTPDQSARGLERTLSLDPSRQGEFWVEQVDPGRPVALRVQAEGILGVASVVVTSGNTTDVELALTPAGRLLVRSREPFASDGFRLAWRHEDEVFDPPAWFQRAKGRTDLGGFEVPAGRVHWRARYASSGATNAGQGGFHEGVVEVPPGGAGTLWLPATAK